MTTTDALWLLWAKLQKVWQLLAQSKSLRPVPTSSDSTGFCSTNSRIAVDGLRNCLTLQQNQVLRMPKAYRKMQVLSGTAWVTVTGKDIILTRGERVSLTSGRNLALVSGLGEAPLVLQVWKHRRLDCREGIGEANV